MILLPAPSNCDTAPASLAVLHLEKYITRLHQECRLLSPGPAGPSYSLSCARSGLENKSERIVPMRKPPAGKVATEFKIKLCVCLSRVQSLKTRERNATRELNNAKADIQYVPHPCMKAVQSHILASADLHLLAMLGKNCHSFASKSLCRHLSVFGSVLPASVCRKSFAR